MGTGIGIAGVIFSVDESSVINGVDFTFTRFVRWNDPVVAESNDGDRVAVPREGAVIQAISEQTIDLLTEQPLLIQGVRGDTAVYGDQTITYDVPGMLWQTADAGVTLQAVDLAAYVEGAGEVIIDRRGWGAIVGEIEVLDTVVGVPGDYIDLEAPHQINSLVSQSPVTQRGGTRKVQIVGRTPHAGTATLHLEDAGNLAQTLPTPEDTPGETALPVPTFTLAADDDFPLTIATATVTNATTIEEFGADVEWEYAVSLTEPVVPGTPFGPLLLGFGETEIDTPAVPSGSTVWVRARSAIAATGERSDWSAWQDITLGPDDDGAGGTLPPFLLALSISATGVLSAEATSVVEQIIKVYFVAGVAGGAAPSYAATLAGTTDVSGPPFTAASLATMAEGEVRTVGAIGEDALGNRTVLVLSSITRAVDTGSGAGTPGDAPMYFFLGRSGDDLTMTSQPSAEEDMETGWQRRNLARSGFVQLQSHVITAGHTTAEIGLKGSLDDGDTFDWLDGDAGPIVSLAANTPPVIRGPPVAIDAAFRAGPDVLIKAVRLGGNASASPSIRTLLAEFLVGTPPAPEEEEPPTEGDFFVDDGATTPWYAQATYPPAMYVAATNTSWFSWESFEGPKRVLMVATYNHTTEEWSSSIPVATHALADNSHGIPALIRDADGYVHLFGGAHDTTMSEWVTEDPDDPSSWWLRNTFSATVGYSYAHPVLLGSVMYLFMREKVSAVTTRRLVVFKTTSLSGGVATWSAQTLLVSLGTDSRVYATAFFVVGTDIHFTFCLANDDDTVRRNGYYAVYDTVANDLHNIDDSFTVATGSLPLGRTDADNEFRFLSQTTDQSNLPSLAFDTNGDPHVVIMAGVGATGGNPDGVYDLLHFTHDGASWSSPVTVVPDLTMYRSAELALVTLPDGELALYYEDDPADAYEQGGTMKRKIRSAGGVWGAASGILAPDTLPLARASAVRNAHADARVIFSEVAASDDDAETGAGTLKGYVYGDNGLIARDPIVRAALNRNVAGAAAGTFETGTDPEGTFITLKGLPMSPAGIVLFSSGVSAVAITNGTGRWCEGIAAKDGTQALLASINTDAADPSQEHQYHSDSACYTVLDTGGVPAGKLGIDAMGADWIRFEILEPFPDSRFVSYMVIPGSAGTVAAFTEGDTTVTTPGVDPEFAFFLASNDTTAPPNTSNNSTISIGAAAGTGATDQFVIAGGAQHNAATSVAAGYGISGDVIALHNAGVTALDAYAQLTAMGTGDLTLNWTATASTRRGYCLATEGGQYKVGKSLTSTVLNNDTAVTGFGFAPEAVMAFINRRAEASAGATVAGDWILCQGAGSSTSNRHMHTVGTRHNQATPDAMRGHTSTELLRGVVINTAGTDSIVQLQAMGGDGFTHRQTDPGGTAHWMPYIGVAD